MRPLGVFRKLFIGSMPTGDVRATFEVLRRLLVKTGYPKDVDVELLCKGYTDQLIQVLHFAAVEYSPTLARSFAKAGHVLHGGSDERFVTELFRLLRSVFDYRPKLSVRQFTAKKGFAEQKILLACDLIKFCVDKNRELTPKKRKVPKSSRKSRSPPLSARRPPLPSKSPPPRRPVSARTTTNPWDSGRPVCENKENVSRVSNTAATRTAKVATAPAPAPTAAPQAPSVAASRDDGWVDITSPKKEAAPSSPAPPPPAQSSVPATGGMSASQFAELVRRLKGVESTMTGIQSAMSSINARFVVLEGKVKFLEERKRKAATKSNPPTKFDCSSQPAKPNTKLAAAAAAPGAAAAEPTPDPAQSAPVNASENKPDTKMEGAVQQPEQPEQPSVQSSLVQRAPRALEQNANGGSVIKAIERHLKGRAGPATAGVSSRTGQLPSLSTEDILSRIDAHFQATEQILAQVSGANA